MRKYNYFMNKPIEIAANYVGIAKGKTAQKWYVSFILGVLAGAFIAFGGALATVAGSGFAGIQAALIKGAVFPLGLILVVICGAELFTGNCLLIAPLLSRDIEPVKTLKSWGIVYLGNFVGASLVAVLVVYGGSLSESGVQACISVAAAKSSTGFGYMFLRAIPCNILVCLAVWAAMASKSASGKILAVYLPVFAFVVCGFEHSIANMYYIMAGSMASGGAGFNFGYGVLNGIIAPTLGNIIGGGAIAVAYFAVYFKRSKPLGDELASKEKER